MDVFFEAQDGSTFSMKLGYWYTVLEIKQKIEKSHRIPVSKQTLVFKGKVLQDDLDVEDCVHNSRIQLLISPDHNPNPTNAQVPQTTEESSQLSNSLDDQDWYLTDEEFSKMEQFWPVTNQETINVQDSTVPVGSKNNNNNQVFQTEQYPQLKSTEQFINVQDLPVMVGSYRNDQVFDQTEQSPVPSNLVYGQDWYLPTEQITNIQQYRPLTTKEITPGMVGSDRNNQVLQTEQSPASNSIGDIIYDQEWPFSTKQTTNIQQHWPLTPKEITPEMVGSNRNDQVLQTVQSPPSNSTGDTIYSQDWPFTTEQTKIIQQYWPVTNEEMVGSKFNKVLQTEQYPPLNSDQQFIDVSDFPVPGWSNKNNNTMLQTEQSPLINSAGQFINVPDNLFPPWSNKNNNQVLQTEQSPQLNSAEQFINVHDFPVTVGSNKNDQLLQTEQSPPSNTVKEVINIPDSPAKVNVKRSNNKPPRRLRVMVMVYPETRKISVEVNAGAHVEELRKELAQIQQKFELNLPQDGYFFIHKQNVMDEDRSFWWNRVNPGDTIEVFPGTVTSGSLPRGFH